MVATEERKIAARKNAEDTHQERSKPSSTEKETKNKILHSSKSAGKIDFKEAEAIEAKNQQTQNDRREAAKATAQSPNEVKVSERRDNKASPGQ
jgi:hypothetical protein